MAGNDDDRGNNRRVGAEDRGRSRGCVTLCVVCTVHKEMRSASFLVQPENQGRRLHPV
jgi:hypothetical protein